MRLRALLISAAVVPVAAAAIVPGVLTSDWPWAVKIGPSSSNPNTTATIVGDHWVLTAGHVVSTNPQMQIVTDGGTRYDSTSIHKHPTDDIALVRFSDALPGWYRPTFTAPAIGTEFEMVGFGRTGSWNGSSWSWVIEYGNKRHGRNEVSSVAVLPPGGGIVGTFLVGDFDGNGVDTYGDGGPIANEATFGGGDSGGPCLVWEAGEWKVVGVNVFIGNVTGGPTPPQYGSIMGAARVASYQSWIDSIMPREVRPYALTTIRWTLVSGGLNSLYERDDDRIVARPGIVLSPSQAPIEFIIVGTCPTTTATELTFAFEGSASSTGINARVELFDWVANAYVMVINQASTISDSIIEATVTANPSRFIEPNSREVRARISAKAVAPVLVNPWTFRVDRSGWHIKIP